MQKTHYTTAKTQITLQGSVAMPVSFLGNCEDITPMM